jgi:hypothetical protein
VFNAGKAKANNSFNKRRSTQSAGIKSPKSTALLSLLAIQHTPTKKFLKEGYEESRATKKTKRKKKMDKETHQKSKIQRGKQCAKPREGK